MDLHLADQALSLCSPPLTVSTSSHLQSLYGHCPPGTVVFLQPEQTLVFKVDIGWRYIVVRFILQGRATKCLGKLNFHRPTEITQWSQSCNVKQIFLFPTLIWFCVISCVFVCPHKLIVL